MEVTCAHVMIDFDVVRRVIKLIHDPRFKPIFRPTGVFPP